MEKTLFKLDKVLSAIIILLVFILVLMATHSSRNLKENQNRLIGEKVIINKDTLTVIRVGYHFAHLSNRTKVKIDDIPKFSIQP